MDKKIVSNFMAQYSKEAYERIQELCEENGIFHGVRIHKEFVQKQVAKLLGISYFLPSNIVNDLILEHQRNRWIKAFLLYPNDEFRHGIQAAILKTYHRQGNLWENIRSLIKTHNTTFPNSKLPLNKDNIGCSLIGKRTIKLKEFMEVLDIQLPIEMNSGGEQSYSLRSIWRQHLDGKFINKNKETTLRKAIIDLKSSLSVVTWQKQVLHTVQAYEQQCQINLGGTSWSTLSRSVIGRDHEYVSQIDFLNFIKKAKKNTKSTL